MDSETLGYIEKVKIAEKGRVSAVDYWEKNDQFVFLIGVTQTSFKFVITDRDFNVLDEFAGVDSSAGNTFQDFCISGDYIISIPFMKRTAEDDTASDVLFNRAAVWSAPMLVVGRGRNLCGAGVDL